MNYEKQKIPEGITELLYGKPTEAEQLAERGRKAADWLESQELPDRFTLGPATVFNPDLWRNACLCALRSGPAHVGFYTAMADVKAYARSQKEKP